MKVIFKLLIITSLVVSCTTGEKRLNLDYSLPAEAYKSRMQASEPESWRRALTSVEAPTGGVTLADGSRFKKAVELNIEYLLSSFTVNHLLYPFRMRAGLEPLPDDRKQVGFWDTDLRGSNAGRYMMGAGNSLRWIENSALRDSMNKLIDGIEECGEADGYILAYPHVIDSLRSEEPNYARAWFTHGLIEAGIAGNPKAFALLRQHADWFNKWDELHHRLLYWNHNSHQGHIASTRTYFSPVGKAEDLQLAEKYYLCDWWIDELAARHDSAVFMYPLQNPHSYLIASFEAYLDHYIATGDKSILEAMLGAWELIHDKWEHVGGSIAICENQWFVEDGKRRLKHYDNRSYCSHPPCSYYLDGYGHTGEFCGSVFWVKFNQRLHRLYPAEEKYVSEIEKSLYNIALANQRPSGQIAYHAVMQGRKETPSRASNSCCEGQGTRLLGSLPEYIYSVAKDGLYVNLYEASSIKHDIDGQSVTLTMEADFPASSDVKLTVRCASPVKMKLHVRTPSWANEVMAVNVNGSRVAKGKPGSFAVVSRQWRDGDEVSFTLPASFRITPYKGMTKGFETGCALEYGPFLMALTGTPGEGGKFRLPFPSTELIDKLKPVEGKPLQFTVCDTMVYMPYYVVDNEQFTTYPLY